jgi:hypothetical protein
MADSHEKQMKYAGKFFIDHILPQIRGFTIEHVKDNNGKVVSQRMILDLELTEWEKYLFHQKYYYETRMKERG